MPLGEASKLLISNLSYTQSLHYHDQLSLEKLLVWNSVADCVSMNLNLWVYFLRFHYFMFHFWEYHISPLSISIVFAVLKISPFLLTSRASIHATVRIPFIELHENDVKVDVHQIFKAFFFQQNSFLPGGLHFWVWTASPWQSSPPLSGTGLVHVLERIWLPFPSKSTLQ